MKFSIKPHEVKHTSARAFASAVCLYSDYYVVLVHVCVVCKFPALCFVILYTLHHMFLNHKFCTASSLFVYIKYVTTR